MIQDGFLVLSWQLCHFFTRLKWQTSELEHADLHRDCTTSQLMPFSVHGTQAFPTGRRSLSVMLIDLSSAFNTIVCLRLVIKLRNMGLNSSLCLRILNMLTGRSQIVDMGGLSLYFGDAGTSYLTLLLYQYCKALWSIQLCAIFKIFHIIASCKKQTEI